MKPDMVTNEGGKAFRAAARALRGFVLMPFLLSACGSGSVADAEGLVPEAAKQPSSAERLGLMRVETASVSSHSDWEAWFAAPWQPQGDVPAAFDAVRFVCKQGDCTVGERLEVTSCDLLFEADSKGLDVEGMEKPNSGYLYRRLVCYAGRTLAAMQDASTSHVSGFVLEPGTLAELPAELGYPGSPDQLEEARRIDAEGGGVAMFLEQVLGITGPSGLQATDEGLRIEDGNNWTRDLLLLGRGDFDDDGIEDLLIGGSLYITDEALRVGTRLYVVTREKAGARMQVTYQIPVLGAIDACNDDTRCANFMLPQAQ